MGCSTSAGALALLVLAASGCVTGHLLDEARRIERPLALHEAALAGDRLLVAYTAVVTSDVGVTLGQRERRAALRLDDLRRGDLPVERFPVVWLPDATPLVGQAVTIGPGPPQGGRPALRVEEDAVGRPARLLLSDGGPAAYPPFWAAALTRTRTAPWVWPLLPLGLAWDAATNPVLLLFAPAVLTVGD